MRNAFILLFALILAQGASAFEVSAPSEIMPGSNWSVWVKLDATNAFTETILILDGEETVSVKPSGDILTKSKKVSSAFVTDEDPESLGGLTLYVSFIGLTGGSHTLRVESFHQGNLTQTETRGITATQFSQKSFEEQITSRVNGLEEQKNSLDSKVSGIEEKVKEVSLLLDESSSKAGENSDEIAAAKQLLDELKGDLRGVKESLDLFAEETEIQNLTQDLVKLNQRVNALSPALALTETPSHNALPPSGLVSLPAGSRQLIALIIGIALIVLGAYRFSGGFNGFSGFRDLGLSGRGKQLFKAREGFSAEKAAKPVGKGKWSYGEEALNERAPGTEGKEVLRRPPAKKRKINFTDLLKK